MKNSTQKKKPAAAAGGVTPRQQHSSFIRNFFLTLLGVLLVYGIFYVGTEIRNNLKEFDHIGVADRPTNVVAVEGIGKVYAAPTIATVRLGVLTEEASVVEAQQENARKMNALQNTLKETGIAEADMQTKEFSLYPRYRYDEGGSELVGYSISHMLEVKIRDLGSIDRVLQAAGNEGVNQISGVDFTIEDKDKLVAEARRMALDKAKEKIWDVSRSLGLEIVGVVGFSEYLPGEDPYYPGPVPYREAYGGLDAAAPEVSIGSETIQVVVTVSYEIR